MAVVAYFGDDDWSIPALLRLLDTPQVTVVAIVERATPSSPSLAHVAQQADIPLFRTHDVNSTDFAQRYAPLGTELAISNSYDQIFRSPFIGCHQLGIINAHTSLLPRYRGRNALTWAMIAGEPVVGVTVHQVDEGIDTGDILTQVAVPVGPDDDFGLVRHRVGNAAATAIAEALHQIVTGTTDPIPQSSLGPGFVVPRRRLGDETINWYASAQQVHDFVRALTPPGPWARTTDEDGIRWAIHQTRQPTTNEPSHVGHPGAVLRSNQHGFTVKCGDSALDIVHWSREPGDDTPSPPLGYRFTPPTEIT